MLKMSFIYYGFSFANSISIKVDKAPHHKETHL